jgi:hypothetical protein
MRSTAKRAAVSAQSTATAIKGLDDVKVASLADFTKLFGYVGQTMQTIPDQQGQQAFSNAANKTLGDASARLLPDFQAKLAALPATFDGASQANTAVAKLTGIPDATGARLPPFKPYCDAARARAAATSSPDNLAPDQKLFWLECQTGPEILRHPPT